VRYGLDTGFLVAAEVAEHPLHPRVRTQLVQLVTAGHRIALAPQVLAEFVHVVTDPKRFALPLSVDNALRLAEQWWTAREVDQTFPNDDSVRLFLGWMQQHRLGRKRLLDTLLAATYRTSGVRTLLTLNPRDFAILDDFECLEPGTA
jgi:predicted nucleic acid-binding protein